MKYGCCLIAFILSWITLSVSEVRWPELLSLTLSQHRGSWGGGAFDEQLPHEQYPWAGTLSCPREPHSPAPFPWWPRERLQFGFNTSKEFEPLLLIMICRRKAPVTKRLWLKDAKLVRHSKIPTRQRKSQNQPLDISQHRQDNTLQQEGKIKSI